jgi:hypothetical protein
MGVLVRRLNDWIKKWGVISKCQMGCLEKER